MSASASQMNTLGTLNQKIADVAKEKEDEDKEELEDIRQYGRKI